MKVPSQELYIINSYLNAKTEDEYQGESSTISYQVEFPNGMAMDVRCCGDDNAPSWAEAVLFRQKDENSPFVEECCTETEESFINEFELEDGDGNIYIVNVLDGGGAIQEVIIDIEISEKDSSST